MTLCHFRASKYLFSVQKVKVSFKSRNLKLTYFEKLRIKPNQQAQERTFYPQKDLRRIFYQFLSGKK